MNGREFICEDCGRRPSHLVTAAYGDSAVRRRCFACDDQARRAAWGSLPKGGELIFRCDECRYFQPIGQAAEFEGETLGVGECRRHAPADRGKGQPAGWPSVWGNDGCGDFIRGIARGGHKRGHKAASGRRGGVATR